MPPPGFWFFNCESTQQAVFRKSWNVTPGKVALYAQRAFERVLHTDRGAIDVAGRGDVTVAPLLSGATSGAI